MQAAGLRAASARAGAPGHPRGPEPTRRGAPRGYAPLPCSGGSHPAAGRSHTAAATSRRAAPRRAGKAAPGLEGLGGPEAGAGRGLEGGSRPRPSGRGRLPLPGPGAARLCPVLPPAGLCRGAPRVGGVPRRAAGGWRRLQSDAFRP